MKDLVTPEAIVSDYSHGKLNLNLALNLIVSILEKSDNPGMRRNSIIALERIGSNNEEIFSILERCLLSDENPFVRSAAAKLIGQAYLKLGLNTLIWVVQHDKSPIVIKAILNIVENKEEHRYKLVNKELTNWINKFSPNIGVVSVESRFFLELEVLFAQQQENYEISPLTYTFYKNLNKLNDPNSLLAIINNHVENLNFNLSNWYFLKLNQDILHSFLDIRDLDTFLDLYKKFEFKDFDKYSILKSISCFNSLKRLKLSGMNLNKFPEFLLDIKTLEDLDLSNNSIRLIPDSIKNLIRLKKLNLSNNKIHNISKETRNFLSSLQVFEK